MQKQRSLRTRIIILLIFFWCNANAYYLLLKLGGFSLLISGLFNLLCLLIIVITLILLAVHMVRNKEWRNRKNYLTIGVCVLFFTFMYFSPMQVNENTFRSPVKIRACYQGTMNTSRLYLRENGNFEDFNIGFFAYVHYYSGTWKQSGDTLMLSFKNKEPHYLGEKLIIKNELLYKIQGDTLSATYYYLGECR